MDNFVGEIKIFGGNFAPSGWHYCDGALMSIAEYQVLFTLIGTTYGGDGVNTFALPDLRGRIVVSQGRAPSGTTYVIGMPGGNETVTLTPTTIPSHQHTASVSTSAGTTISPNNNFLATPTDQTTNNKTILLYEPAGTSGLTNQPFLPTAITNTGGSLPHENRMPYVSISYIIALFGIFPSSN
jgi:microcystin-dependent protein